MVEKVKYWKKVKLIDVCTKITDGTHKTPGYIDEGICFLSAKNIVNGRLCFDKCKYISYEEHNSLIKRCYPESGDLLLSKSGSLGDAVVIPQISYEFSIFESLALLKLRQDIINPEFLKQYLNSSISKKYFISITSGQAVKHLHLVDLRKMPISIPILNEQQKIAEILQTWDKAIQLTEQLIEKKERYKNALMQMLLSGKFRFLKFKDKWKIERLGNIAEMKSGGTPLTTVKSYYGGNIPWVSIADMTKCGKWIESTQRNLSVEGLNNSSASLYPKNTVLYAMYASIGECSIAKKEVSSSQAILGIKPRVQLNYKYLYFYLSSLKERIKLKGQQGTQANLNAGMVKSFRINLPSLKEQQKIANILDTFDNEITLLIEQLASINQTKKSLMQKLLTGKICISNTCNNELYLSEKV